MDEKRMKALREWVQQWEKTGPELNRIRKLEAGNFDLAQTIDCFNDAFESALAMFPPDPDSGLVEQQRLYSRLRS